MEGADPIVTRRELEHFLDRGLEVRGAVAHVEDQDAGRPRCLLFVPADESHPPPAAEEIARRLNAQFPELDLSPGAVHVGALPLTTIQSAMVLQSLAAPGCGVAIGQLASEPLSDVDEEVLAAAWSDLVGETDALRLRIFQAEDNEFRQDFAGGSDSLEIEDWSSLPADKHQERFEELKQARRREGFDSDSPSLVRLTLVRLGSGRVRLLWTYHNAVMDEVSLGRLLARLAEHYDFRSSGGPVPQAPTDPHAFARLLCRRAAGTRNADREFWRETLGAVDEPTPLRCETLRPRQTAPRPPLRLTANWNGKDSARLLDFAENEGLELRVLALGAWTLTLRHWTDRGGVLFGMARAGRSGGPEDGGLAGNEMIGLAVNTVPFPADAEDTVPVREFLVGLAELDARITRHEETPLDEIRRASSFEAGERLFETLLVCNAAEPGDAIPSGHPLAGAYRYEGQGGLPVTMTFTAGEEIGLKLECDPNRYTEATAQRLLAHFDRMLRELPEAAGRPLGSIGAMGPEDAARLAEWNRTGHEFELRDLALHELFERAADRHPDRTAIVADDGSMTFGELEAEANRIAHHLRGLGIGPDRAVALLMERSLRLMPAVYGILKAGGYFVPLDPHHPSERLAGILAECEAAAIFIDGGAAPDFGSEIAVLDLTDPAAPWRDAPASRPESVTRGGHAAYAIFTSGSTGRPKGVVVEHRSIVNHDLWMGELCALDGDSAALLKTPLTFDAVMWELFVPLESGARLVIAEKDGHKSARYLVEVIREHGITHLHYVASLLELFLAEPGAERCESLRCVFCGGEAIGKELEQRFGQTLPNATLLNVYAPAETTVTVTTWACDPNDPYPVVPIGRPAPNNRMYLLDRHGRPCPLGVAGELYIGGVQVARGYVGRDDLTAERFLADPFGSPGDRMYRTGDLARFRDDGCLEFLGRADFQVKVRGLRIELEEIEAVLRGHEAILQCVVIVARPTPDDQRIVAYYTAREKEAPTAPELRRHLGAVLPEYMLPQHFVQMETMPLNASGKVDRRALPSVEAARPDLEGDYVEARTGLEAVLAEQWRGLLKLPQVGVQDRFFELGGSSLKAIQFVAWLGGELGEPFSIADFFAAPTIEGVIGTLENEYGAALGRRFPDHRPAQTRPEAGLEVRRPGAGDDPDDLAVIGLAGRFPDAGDIETFWQNLVDGVESVRIATDDELRSVGVPEEVFRDEDYVRSYLSADDLDGFDAEFFGYTPGEAALMDPQHRLFLELAWTALDNAGYSARLENEGERIGVFGGVARDAYSHEYVSRHPDTRDTLGEFSTAIGNDKNFPTTRVAYKLNLTGPAINVQTACSTSGVALHVACQNLQLGECDVAVVGGCRVLVPRTTGFTYVEGSALSASGRLYTFDHRASGMVRGSGGVCLVVKRLGDAQRDGDPIRGVIKATAINNDGDQKAGFTAPSVGGQSAVIRSALRRAGVSPETIGYVEAHGTATALGDPIEVLALTRAWRSFTDRKQFCRIGSVKPNVGHLDAGAAAAGIAKSLLAMERGLIPPSINFEKPNPEIDFENSPFAVADRALPWAASEGSPLRAAVSSFGLGGTNFHAVLEQAPATCGSTRGVAHGGRRLVTLSARSEVSLAANLAGLVDHLRKRPEVAGANLAYSLNTRRPRFEWRATLLTAEDGTVGPTELAAAMRTAPTATEGRIEIACPETIEDATDALRSLLSGRPGLVETLADCWEALGIGEADARETDLSERVDGATATFLLQVALGRFLHQCGVTGTAWRGSGPGAAAAGCLRGELAARDALASLETRTDLGAEAQTADLTIELGGTAGAGNGSESVTARPDNLDEIVGAAWRHGADIAWGTWYAGQELRRVDLPPFRFERRRHWLDLPQTGPRLLHLTASTPAGLDGLAHRAAALLEIDPESDPSDWAAREAGAGESCRLATVGLDRAELRSRLADPGQDREAQRWTVADGEVPVAFLFPGGGAQYLDMARGLYDRVGSFRAEIDRGLALFGARTGIDLKRIWFAPAHEREAAAEQMRRPAIQLPAIFILEMALARMWQSWGLQPTALVGHSLGENTAACLAGVFGYEDALGLVTLRGELFEQTEPGAMISVPLAPDELAAHLDETVDLGTINAPQQCTVSGRTADIERLVERLEKAEVDVTRVPITTAPHSRLLDPILDRFGDYLRSIPLSAPRIPFLSNVTGDWITEADATDPEYWVRHLRRPVRFADCLATLAADAPCAVVETGPGKVLGSLVRAQNEEMGQRTVHSLRHAQEEVLDDVFLLRSIGRLLALGAPLKTGRIEQDLPGRIVTLSEQAFNTLLSRLQPAPAAAALPWAPLDPLAAPAAPAANPLPNESAVTMTRNEYIRQRIRSVLADMSGLEGDDLPNDVPFLKMGFDSLFLTQANLKLKKALGVRITLKQLMRESPTIDALAGFVDGKLPEEALREEMSATAAPAPAAANVAPAATMVPGVAPVVGGAPQNLQQAIAMQIQASNALLAQLLGAAPPAATAASAAAPPAPAAPAAQPVPAEDTTAKSDESDAPAVHGPFAPVQRGVTGEMTEEQREYLADFTRRYVEKTKRSKELATSHRPHYADPRTVLGFKSTLKEMTYTLVGERSKGSRVWDVDGNEYVDCQGGFGAILFGHAPDFLVDAVRDQLEQSIDYGPQSPRAGRVAELFCELTGMDRASFCNTGSEASLAAIRIARTVTGNDLIVMFQGSYHGIFDEVLVRGQDIRGERRNVPIAPGIPQDASSNVLVLDYGDPASLQTIRDRADEIAGVIVEPIQSRHCEIQPREFLHELRDITKQADIPLIFDEIITGFRLHPRGAQAWYDIEADLACYGKVVGNGIPIGVIAGRKRYMDTLDGGPWQFGDDSFPEVGVTYFAGTFVRHPLALAAAEAVLKKLKEAGPTLQADLNRRTAVLAERINRAYRRMGVPIELVHFASAFFIRYRGNPDLEFLYYHHLKFNGAFHIWGNRLSFMTTEHSPEDMEFLYRCFVTSAEQMQEAGFFPKPAEEPARLVPFTDVQSELWLAIAQGERTASAYNEQVMFEIEQDIDPEVMELVVDRVTNRHPGLRAVPAPDGEGLLERHYCAPDFAAVDLGDLPDDEREARVRELAQKNIDDGFDFGNGPLLRVRLMRMGPRRNVICAAINHLVCDGWSLEILMEDIAGYYTQIAQSRMVQRRRVVPLDEILAAEKARRESGEIDEAREYWLKVYQTLPPDLDLPLDRPRPALRTLSGERHSYYLDPELSERIRRAAEQEGATAFVYLLSVYLLLLNRLTGQDDLVVGIPVAGQPSLDLRDAVTHAVSLLPLRAQVDRGASFRSLVSEIRDHFTEAMDQQGFAYGELLKELPVSRDPARTPLMSASFNVDQAFNPIRLDDVLARFVPAPRGRAKLDLLYTLTDEGDRYLLEVDRNADVTDPGTIDRWVAAYRKLIEGVLDDPDGPIGGLPILAEGEQELLLRDWLPDGPDHRDQSVPGMFAEQARLRPDHPALQAGGRTLTYAELERESLRFAAYLRSEGITAGDRVGVCLDRSVHLPIALLGILQAGAAYVPIDPQLPGARIEAMLNDAELATVLIESRHAVLFAGSSARLLALDRSGEKIAACAAEKSAALPTPDQAAYVIFTSGSTGRPKGVQIDHGGMGNLLASLRQKPGLGPDDRVLAITTISFDPSVIELFLPLVSGATLVLAESDEAADGARLRGLLEQHGITFMNATATIWRLVLDAGWSPSGPFRALCGGEAMPADLAAELAGQVELWNMYGPTEASVAVSGYRVPAEGGPILIGSSLAGAHLHVLDENLAPVPLGVAGELCIAGPGLAAGYVGREDLTGERFVVSPHAALDRKRLYRTGDLVRWRPDGNLEFLGRNDLQVKINGLRIELGEIETVLTAHPDLQQCVVATRNGPDGAPALVAFVVPGDGRTIQPEALIDYAAGHLPRYMVPRAFVPVAELPLAATGKIDRAALAKLADDGALRAERRIEPAADETEKQILTVWREILELDEIGVTEDFFALGGHSLRGIRMLARLRGELDIDLGLRELFEAPTIRGLAVRARGDDRQRPHDLQWGEIPRRDPDAVVPASSQQARVWYLGEVEPTYLVAQYVSTALRLLGPIDIAAMQRAADEVIDRHEALRTNLVMQDGELVQKVNQDVRFDLEPIPMSGMGASTAEELVEALVEESMVPPDVAQDRLFRIRLFRVGDDDHVIVFTVHHLVFDGWSYDILYDEFFAVYNATAQSRPYELQELPVQYGDFSLWQRDWLHSDAVAEQVRHWRDVLADSPTLALPTDFPRPARQVHTSGELQFHFDAGQVAALDELARRHDCTMFMVMIGLYTLMLARSSRQTDFVIGSPISGRNNAAISDLIGFFVNTLLFRFRLDPEQTLGSWLAEVKAVCVDAFGHQDAPFEHIVQELNPPRDASRSPVFQTLFIFQDVRNREIHLHDLEIRNFHMERLGVQTDLDLWLKREHDELWGGLLYPTSLFREETAQGFVDALCDLVERAGGASDTSLAELTGASAAELELFESWNRTKRDLPDGTFLDRFARMAAERPDHRAVIAGDHELTYAELDRRSNRLARYLQSQGVEPGALVGLSLERTTDLPLTVLALWKAGAAYVPLDPAYPAARLRYMIEQAGIRTLVTHSRLVHVAAETDCRRIELDLEAAAISDQSSDPLEPKVDRESAAYVIFTSGSTGDPKGVQVHHGALLNFLTSMADEPGMGPDDRLLAVTTPSFDIHVLELYLPLFVGATLVVAGQTEARDAEQLTSLLEKHDITVMQATPATWRMLVESGWAGRSRMRILCGGEAFPPDLIAPLCERAAEVWNLYGPTETTVWSSVHRLAAGDRAVAIGRPIANTTIRVLDEQMRPVPLRAAGELYIGGAGVSQGYLGRPDLTAERFVPDPFAPGTVLYRTGDLARWRADGVLECLGRLDDQLKVRGFRIEPGEIEKALSGHGHVRQAAVVTVELGPGDQRLAAFVAAQGGRTVDTEALRNHLRESLPDYMVPQHFVTLDELPLTPAGKVDRRALPDRFEIQAPTGAEIAAPGSETERQLHAIWLEALGLEQLGIDDNFFAVGGHSLLAVTLFARVQEKFGVELPLATLFETPTIRYLAKRIDAERYAIETSDPSGATEGEREEFRF